MRTRVLHIFGLAFVLALTGAVAPGPLLALTIGQVLAGGFPAAALLLTGHALLELVLVALLARGFSRWLAAPRTRAALSLTGGAVLLWMGAGITAGAGAATLTGTAQAAMPWWALVLAGMGVSLSNPYFMGWWVTVGSGQVAALDLRSRLDYAVFFVAHELGDQAWYLLVAALLVFGRQWLTDPVYRSLLVACGLLILALGGLFLFVAARLLLVRPPQPAPAPAQPAAR